MFIDAALALFLALLTLLGFLRGLFSQAWGLGALGVSLWGARPLTVWFQARMGGGGGETHLFESFLVELGVGFLLYVGLILLGRVLELLIFEKAKLLSAGNRVLGAILGLAKGVVLGIGLVWLGQFSAVYLLQASPPVVAQLGESRVVRWVGGYSPLNLIYLGRLRPYMAGVSAREPKALPKAVASPALEAMVADEALAAAINAKDYQAILTNPAFRAAMGDPRITSQLNQLH